MNGKHYSERNLSSLIEAANQYVEATSVREGIIAKCYQELGLIVAGAPVHQRANITLNHLEAEAIRKAIQQWLQEKKQSRAKV